MSKDKTEEEIEYEKRLRRRLVVLKEQMESGKVHFPKDAGIEESLMAVRYGPDGEIDFSTVDGRVRSMALAVTAIQDREDLKNLASLQEIQKAYFNFLEQNFGPYYQAMLDKGLTPHDIATVVKNRPSTRDEIAQKLQDILAFIEEFWMKLGQTASAHVEDMHGNVKGIFGGDLFPSHADNLASKCGLYTDTLILPDPFLRSQHVFEMHAIDDRVYYLIKHALNILQYKELACAEVDPPIVVILPDFASMYKDERNFFTNLGETDSLVHSSSIFGRDFYSFDELMDFCKSLDTVERVVAEVADPSRILFDVDWEGDCKAQIERALQSSEVTSLGGFSPGMLIGGTAVGRMSICNEILVKSRRLNGIPIIDAPTSWRYFIWKLQYDAERAGPVLHSQALHVARGLGDLADSDMRWIGNIPAKALVEIRKEGAMQDIRGILGNGINELIDVDPNDFQGSRDRILSNIKIAFEQHQDNLDQLSAKKWKFAGIDVGSWVVIGSVEVAAAATGLPVWGLFALGANQMLDVPKLKDIPKSIRQLVTETRELKKSPVGMLFNIKKNV